MGQDRVKFHQKPGGDTARPAGPKWSKRWGIRYHVMSYSVLSGGKLVGGKMVMAQEHTGRRAVRVALCILLFVLHILLVRIIVITVRFLYCSVKLPLSRPTSFVCLPLHSPPHPSGERGNSMTAWSFVSGQGQLQQLGVRKNKWQLRET